MTVIDDVEVVLLDDDAPTSRTVELRPRRRWRELALVVAAIAAVVGVGLVGDDEGEDAAASPTTSSTERRSTSTTRARPSTTRRAALVQPSTTRRQTTTTTWPQHEAGTGPILPGGPSGTTVGLVTGNGLVTMVDLDTGDRCTLKVGRDGAWMAGLPPVGGLLLVQSSDVLLGVDRGCAATELDIDLNTGYPVTATSERFWIATGEYGQHLVEHRLPGGEATGREVDLPRYTGASSFILGDDLVIGANGRMTLLDPDTDERRDLGPGNPLATRGSVVAYADCPELRCGLAVLDVSTGERRVIPGVEPVSWDPSTFSADGRLLRVPVPGSGDEPSSAVIDLQTDEVWVLDESVQGPQITPDDRWLVAMHRGEVVAFRIGSDERVALPDGFRDVQGFALL